MRRHGQLPRREGDVGSNSSRRLNPHSQMKTSSLVLADWNTHVTKISPPPFTQSELKELLSYDSATGRCFWRVAVANQIPVGTEAGTFSDGYIRIRYKGRVYKRSRLAWFYTHGEWPELDIDHKNRVRDDDRLDNLRRATHDQNMSNRDLLKSNKSGVSGVRERPTASGSHWVAEINVQGACHYLGTFKSKDEAVTVRAAAEKHYFGEFAPAAV